MRPLHLLLIALGAGVFTMIVTTIATGGFTEKVNDLLVSGDYDGLPPLILGLVMGGIVFIVTLLVISMLLLAINPSEVTKQVDRPVLLDSEDA